MSVETEKLTKKFVVETTKKGMYGDGDGLWLQVQGPRQKSWVFRYRCDGKDRTMGLGPVAKVGLLQARQAAARARFERDEGRDPLADRRRKQVPACAIAVTFQQAAESYIEQHARGLTNPKHAAQWSSTMVRYVYPTMGDKLAREVSNSDLVKLLTPIWLTKHETATRVRSRIEIILNSAKVLEGWTGYTNPAVLRGNLVFLLPPTRNLVAPRHHPSLPYKAAPDFITKLRAAAGTGARALEWTILTAARTEMTIGAKWSEIDFQARTWAVPWDRMKDRKALCVPLPDAAMDVLDQMLASRDRPGGYIFPGQAVGKHLSATAMSMVLKRLECHGATTHGFRSTFRTWNSEETDFDSDVCEVAMAHALPGGKTRIAYQRGNLLDKRRVLMNVWAAYLKK